MSVISHLIADSFGSHIGKYSQRLKITQKGETLAQAPLLYLEAVSIISRGVSISADAIEACCERGIPLFFIDSRGTPYASIYSAGLTGTVNTRREQLRAYDDWRATELGITFASGKIQNQGITLKYLAKNRSNDPSGDILREAELDLRDGLARLDRLEKGHIDDVRGSILGIEGNAAQVYWDAIRQIIPAEYQWETRHGRGATDPVNSLLNYGYGILYSQIERALILAGLDPYAGFIHADRPGKPSLTLDFIEPFRQVAVDRVVFGLINRHYVVDQDENGRLNQEFRQTFAQKVLDHLDTKMHYRDKRYPLRHIIQMQARELASFFRGERETYLPYKAEW